jgi:type I restriction enzyme, S subunit
MITYSIIQKSQLEGALRLDAEYYQAEYLELLEKIKKLPHKKLGDLCLKITDGSHQTPPYQESGIPFLMVKDVLEQQINFDQDISFISEDFDKKLKHCKPGAGDILLTKVGSVGISAVVPDDAPNFNIFVSIAVIKNCSGIDKFFLSTFLNSKFGRTQAIRAAKGISQPDLHLEDIKEFLIPIFPEDQQKEISKLVIEAINLFKDSKSLYSQAENLLLEELGLKDFKVKDDLFYVVNLSEIKSAHRADAEYFQPKYEKIFNYLKCPSKTLEKITEFLNHAKQPPYIDNGEIPIITQKHLGRAFLNLEAIADPETKFTNEEWLKKYPQYQLKAGDVLYYSVGAYIGKTNIVLEDLKVTVASFITIIRTTEEINPIYLTVVLNSIIGQLQSEKWQSATAQQYIYPKDIKNFKIPILPKPTQQKIADLVQKSHEARKKAKQLLEQAKRKVEELIEEN